MCTIPLTLSDLLILLALTCVLGVVGVVLFYMLLRKREKALARGAAETSIRQFAVKGENKNAR